MKRASLASRYRPQTFAEVVGQQLATSALSRAASEDRVAPAYLLSGTRGVGKTTIARIFAKALNCEHAPGPEPCNACAQCRQITAGNHVDVCEIDGASNTGVDDVRALRETVGYMPMQGRYKIFIMDEAHMLSKNAFNALLKTLEEPPGHTVFIFATTEAHRFPATIISRCQHFVFRHLSEDIICSHLENILEKEGIEHDVDGVRLIARRAAGSMRDSLSLLDQTLALSGGKLDKETARKSLGLAGREFFNELFAALPEQSCSKVIALCGELLHSGVDIGFFIRELASAWRNLFLYSQEGDKILSSLGATPDEAAFLKSFSPRFGSMHLHAAWQMTLENQKTIAQNPEPGPALELLLLNLALLPRLIPVGNAPKIPQNSGDAQPGEASQPRQNGKYSAPEQSATGMLEEPVAKVKLATDAWQWSDFIEFCQNENASGAETPPLDILKLVNGNKDGDILKISCSSASLHDRLSKKKPVLESALKRFCKGNCPKIVYADAPRIKTDNDLLRECEENPGIGLCKEILGASVMEVHPKYKGVNNAKYE